MSDFTEVKGLIEAQGKAFEEFKATNDARLAELVKGTADPLIEEKTSRINEALNKFGDQLKAIEAKANRPGAGASDLTAEQKEHKAAFGSWMRKGVGESELSALEAKALNITTAADGGYAVPEELDRDIVKKLVDISPMRQVATVRTIGSAGYRKLASVGGTSSGWVGEADARPATNTPKLAEIVPTMGELYANPQATQVMLDDAFFDAENWLAAEVAEEFARAEGAAFISGNGTNRPTGFLTGAPVSTADDARAWGVLQYVASGTSAALPAAATYADKYIDIVTSLKAGYRTGAVWMCSKTILGELRKVKTSDNAYLWQPSLQAGTPGSFLGYPVVEAEDMPAVGASTFPLAFGNFGTGYLIVDRMGTRILRDPYSNKPYVGFYSTKRVGGIVQNSEAIKLLKCAAS
jgi:HK97 family phage major capsid protein